MSRITLLFLLLLAPNLFGGELPIVQFDGENTINITRDTRLIDTGNLTIPNSLTELSEILDEAEFLEQIPTQGGRYWHSFKIQSSDSAEFWLDISNRIVADIRLYQLTDEGKRLNNVTGLFHSPEYPLLYAQQMRVPEGESTWLLELEHPYFSGNPSVIIRSESAFRTYAQNNLLIIIGCLGAIYSFAFFNAIIGYWSKNSAYFWYSSYLIAVGFTWTAFFNIFDHFFGINMSGWNFTVFFLMVLFGTNFYLSFLRFPESHQWLYKLSKWFRLSTLLALGYYIWPLPFHYVLTNLVVGVWIILAIISGIVSYRSGYKPARFYLAGFSFVFLSSAITILTQFGLFSFIEYTYRFTLITQTIDVILLSLALADQINVLRHEKENALTEKITTESHALVIEQNAAKQLQEANVKLDTALRIALNDKEQKRRAMMLIGHELRTPLQSLIALLEDAEKQTGEAFDHWCDVNSATNKLKRHIENLVTLAETTSGETSTVSTSVSIRLLIESTVNEVCSQRNVVINLADDIFTAVPDFVRVDGILLKKAIGELLDNAVIHSHKPVTIKLSYADNRLCVQICDQGDGFPQDLLGEFRQAASGFSRDTEGLGIGLTIVSRIADLMNAKLDIERLNVGTRISFSVDAPAITIDLPRPSSQTVSCLVAEDNLVNQKVLVKMLEKMEFKVELANNGQEAVTKCEQHTFDIILMDLQMPLMDGFEASLKIRNKGFAGPIIAVTANTEQAAREQALISGMNDIIGKPVQLQYLQSFLCHYV